MNCTEMKICIPYEYVRDKFLVASETHFKSVLKFG